MIEEISVDCPYCGVSFVTLVDCSAGDQSYVEDCQVCCAPINFSTHVNERFELVQCTLRRDDD